MTSKILSAVKSILSGETIKVDPTNTTAFDVYNKILDMVEPVDNVGYVISDDIAKAILVQFDYRSLSFQQDVDLFCRDISRLKNALVKSDDRALLIVVSVLEYVKNTDINQNEANKLINDIFLIEKADKSSVKSEIDLMAELFKGNVIGSRTLEVNSTSQMMEVISSANEFLGVGCINQPSVIDRCAISYMKTPKELGIRVDQFLSLNQQVKDGTMINFKDLESAINSLKVDANIVDLEEFKPTIYDILNIRFCWSFRWIFHWILTTPSEETGRFMLNIVIGCLLKTDKQFIELDYGYLTLIEIALNCMDYVFNGKSYYNHIRAKNLNYKEKGMDVPSHLNSIYGEIRELQSKIVQAFSKYGYYEPVKGESTAMESLIHVISSDINANQGNCLEGTVVQKELYESISTMQLSELIQCLNREKVSDISDIKKLLGESFKLGTVLEAETTRLQAEFQEGVAKLIT